MKAEKSWTNCKQGNDEMRKHNSIRCPKGRQARVVPILASLLAMLITNNIWAQPVEPLAGTWKTWVLTSGSQLRLPLPPNDVSSELGELRALESQRTAAVMDQVSFWDAGSPGFRWIEMTYPLGLSAPNSRVWALVSVAIYDATVAAWDSKYAYNRPRPAQADPTL